MPLTIIAFGTPIHTVLVDVWLQLAD